MTELESYFNFRCEKGLAKRGLAGQAIYEERLNYELGIIQRMGFISYFLVVSDIIGWARTNNIPVGPGRGSAAGSLVAYVLEITHIDPIKYGLIFERFLNPDRVSMPDIDMDFCEEQRDDVIRYVEQKYGKDKVAHIGTFGSMKAKAAIRDVTRARGFPYDLGDKLAKMTLEPVDGKPQSLATCYEKVVELNNYRNGEKSDSKEILVWAEKLENRLRSFGTHASGIVISNEPITKIVPLYPGKNGMQTTQFEMNTIEEIGLIKFDLLGLRALTTIKRCLRAIKHRHGKNIDILNIPVDDPQVYKLLQEGNVDGVFQLECSSGMRDLLVRIRPMNLDDIALLVAIYRPGPLGSDMLNNFLKVRAGESSPQFCTPELEPILGVTDGMLIYQEQILEICKKLAGYSLSEADIMRRVVGKKKEKEMAAQELKFKQGMKNNGFSDQVAKQIWDDIQSFAAYGFNKAHAVCYGFISYQMAYLKTYYSTEFMCACLISDSDENDKMIQYLNHCSDIGIKVEGPSVNISKYGFSIADDKTIRFGLSAIKNLGKPVKEIIDERVKNGPYKSIQDFMSRVSMTKFNSRKMESLALSGAFDGLGNYTRASLLSFISRMQEYREEYKKYEVKRATFQKRNDAFLIRQQEIAEWEADPKSKKKPGLLKVPVAPEMPPFPEIIELKEMALPDLLSAEKELTGFYISGHPLDTVSEKSRTTIANIKENGVSRQHISLLAIPSDYKEITTKKAKQKMAYLQLEDKSGTIQAIILPKPYAQYRSLVDIHTPCRYDVEVEVTEGDVGKLVKLIITSITMLKSVQEFRDRMIEITVPFTSLVAVSNFLKENKGKDNRVHLRVGGDRATFDCGVFPCKGDRATIEKLLKDI